jgi:hypothetical protein
MAWDGRGLTVFSVVINRVSSAFSKQVASVLVQMFLEVLAFHSKLGWKTLSGEGTLSTIFTLGEHTTCGHKLTKGVLEVLSSFRFAVTLGINPWDLLNPSDISRGHFFIDGRQHIAIISHLIVQADSNIVYQAE